MHSITCTVRDFNATADTCSVEVQGIGIVDTWIDGVAIAPTVDRSYIVAGAPGVITVPDINRPCDATLIQVTPPGQPVSYDPDQIITYTGSLLVNTDTTGAGCQDVVFPVPYSSVPIVSASAAHPASVTISNVTEAGFTACVTGGRVSSKHAVSYSSKSTRTTTATKNRAPTVQHNEVDVATHYNIDFKDGDVVFTVTDRDTPARSQIEATLSDTFKATLGGSGGGSGLSFATGLMLRHDTAFAVTNSRTAVPWDQIYLDNTSGLMWSSAHPTRLVAPADGVYNVAAWAQLTYLGSLDGSGQFEIDIALNGYEFVRENYGPIATEDSFGDVPQITVTAPIPMKKNDYIEMWVSQTTGTSCTLAVGAEETYLDYPFAVPLMSGFAAVFAATAGPGPGYSTTVTLAGGATPISASTPLTWSSIISDNTAGLIWDSANPTRLKAPIDGVYLVTANLEIGAANATAGGATLLVELYINADYGVPSYEASRVCPPFPSLDREAIGFAVPLTLAKDDYIELGFGCGFDPAVTSMIPNGSTLSITHLVSGGSIASSVSSIDGLSGDIGLLAGSGISVTTDTSNNITVTNTAAATGMPAGGSLGDVLTKLSATDYDAAWEPAAGGGGAPSGPAGGDLSGTYPNPSLATTAVTAGTYGDSTHIPVITVDGKGRATGVTTVLAAGGPTYTLPDATTAAIGGVKIDYPPATADPIALTQNSQGQIRTAGLPAGSADVDPTLKEGDLLYRHPPATGKIGFIGDSITLNTPSGGSPPPTNTAADLTAGSFTATAVNQGAGSTTSTDWTPTAGTGFYTTAKAAFLAAGVTVAHIMLGTNDAKTAVNTSQTAYKNNLSAICADLNAAGIICVLSYPPYVVPGSGSGAWNSASLTALQRYAAAIDQLVNGTTIRQGDVNAYTYFSSHSSELSDGIHPTAAGSVDLAQFWANALKPVVTAPLARLPLGATGTALLSNGVDPYWGTPPSSAEMLVTDGTTNPPEALWTEDGTDFLYEG